MRHELVIIGAGPGGYVAAIRAAQLGIAAAIVEREPRLGQVARISARLAAGLGPLDGLPGVAGVRVKGAIGAVQLERPDIPWFRARFLERGAWIRPFGDIVYLMPAFTIADDELDLLVDAVVESVRAHVLR